MKRSPAARSRAARKGWETRRRNERGNRSFDKRFKRANKAISEDKIFEFLRRSEATQKGWETRRKNEQKRKRKPAPPRVPTVEYVLNFDYKLRRTGKVIDVQVHLFGPEVIKKEVKRIYNRWFRTGKLDTGWSVRVIAWQTGRGRRKRTTDAEDARRFLNFALERDPYKVEPFDE